MGQALYRKYRSKSLSEIVGQDHITQTLTQALKQGRISHAYLFTGPRGVGKTSIARILAHEINNLEYSDDSAHLDIIEIDAASNRRIDEIRELRDKVYVAPTSAKYKVYIIDEVHMLTREAFNALLKTLEEPPEHAVFILATTDAHKVPETIVSRTQRYTFKPVPQQQVVEHLKQISKKEKIDVTDEALELLAQHGEGSFRDSISMLDQARSHGSKLDGNSVRMLLGIPPSDSVNELIQSLSNGKSAELVTALTALYDQGFQAAAIAKQLSQTLRTNVLNDSMEFDSALVFVLLNRLLDVPQSHDPERFLEIILLECQSAISPSHQTEDKLPIVLNQDDTPIETIQSPEPAPTKKGHPEKPTTTKEAETVNEQITQNNWDSIVQLLKQRHNTLYGIIRMAVPTFNSDGSVELVFSFAFHQKRINESNNQKALAAIMSEVVGRPVHFNCTLDTSAKPKPPVPAASKQPAPKKSEDLTAISNIFGGGELLES